MTAEPPRREDPPVPEISEQIHLPGPTYIPIIVAAGITLTLVGVVMTVWVLLIGLALFIFPLLRWIADTRRDIEELPLEHGEH